MTRNVAIYARVSTEHLAQLSALENQVQYYDDLLKRHPEWKVYDKYIDEGITGTSTKKRKNFLRMIEDASKGCFDLIVTREVSRFARNTVDTLQETRKLKKIGVEVYFTEDNIWTLKDDDGELKLTIMATLAQNESKKTSIRVKAGQKISFQNGVFYGTGNILGYDKVGKDMVVNEKQAEIVKLIFELFLKGLGSTKIKYELEKRGYLTSTGLKNWSSSYINRILKNEFYSGTIVYRKYFVPDFLEQKPIRNTGQVEQIIVEGKHTPLVSKEDFAKAQILLSEHRKHIDDNSKGRGAQIAVSVWTKKLKCDCGSSFNRRTYYKRKDGTQTFCYQCYNQKNHGSKKVRLKKGLETENSCDIPLVQEWKLKVMAKCVFENIYKDTNQILNIANEILDEAITEDKINYGVDNKINENKKILTSLKNKSEILLDTYIGGLISKEDFAKKKSEIEKAKEEINIILNELQANESIPIETVEQKIKHLKRKLKVSIDLFDNDIIDEFIDNYVDEIIVYSDHFAWKLNIVDDVIEMKLENNKESKKKAYFKENSAKSNPDLGSGPSCNQSKEELILMIKD